MPQLPPPSSPIERWFAIAWKPIVVVLVAIMAAALVTLALRHVSSSNVVAAPKHLAATSPIPEAAQREDDERPRAVFLGDSYTAGTGATAAAKRWSSLVAADQGWKEMNAGEGGTGYVATASETACGRSFCDNYAGRVDSVVKESPDIVIVAGGQNDLTQFQRNADAVEANISKLFDDLHTKLPTARLIAVGPSTTADLSSQVRGIDEAVRAAAEANGATYVSLIEPNVIDREWVTADGGHVNDDGHAAIAERVLAALR